MTFALHTSIEIEASAERVWSILTDFAAYPSWNPLLPKAAGALAVGERLTVALRAPSGGVVTIKPTLIAVEPSMRLQWRGSLPIPGLFVGEHAFVLVPLGDGRVRLVHEEQFSGLLIPLLRKMLDTGVRSSFEAMNRALKARAEASQF
jgi:hypothetical protein